MHDNTHMEYSQDRPASIVDIAIQVLVDNAPDAMLVVDRQGLIVSANFLAEELFGYSSVEIIGNTLELLLPQRYRAVHFQHRQHFFTSPVIRGMADALEVVALRKDGTEFPAEVSLRPFKTGADTFVLSAIRNVTERKRTEVKLRETLRRFSAIFNSTFQFIGLMQPDGLLIEANQTALDFSGTKLEDEVGRPFWECSWWKASGTDREALRNAIRRAAQGEFVRYEVACAGAGNRMAEIDFSIKPVFDEHGSVVLLIPEGRDITERKKAEAALQYRDAILEVVGFAAEKFLKADSWTTSVQEALYRIGEAAGVSRVYIFKNHDEGSGALRTSLKFEWTAPGVRAFLNHPNFSDAVYDEIGFSRWVEFLSKGKPLFGLVRDFPASEAEWLCRQDIKALVVVPIFVGGSWWGFMGIDECRSERYWTEIEIDALKVAANTFGAALQRRQQEEALLASEQRFSKAFQLAPVATAIISLAESRFVDVNCAFETLTGYSASEAIGSCIDELNIFPQPLVSRQFISLIRESGICHDFELTIRSKEAMIREVLASADTVEVEGHACILVMFYDVTDRKRLQREIARLTATEQRQIGYDLHEDLAQQLASTALLSGVQLRKLQEEGSRHAETMARISGMLGEAIAYSRDLSHRLSPVDVHSEGLTYALRGLTESTESMLGVPCRFESNGSVFIHDNHVATHLYRIAQDIIRHAVRQGRPKEIIVELQSADHHGVMSVYTDGIPVEGLLSDEIALSQMRYRADSIRATFLVQPEGTNGCKVECIFDL